MAKVIKLRDTDRIYNTSFHNGKIYASFEELEEKLGVEAHYEGDSKVSYEMDCEVDGIAFTIYDWKEGAISKADKAYLHIGTDSVLNTLKVCDILEKEYGLSVQRGSPESNLLNTIFGK